MPQYNVKRGDFQFITQPARFCCGLQEVGNLHFIGTPPLPKDVSMDPAEISRIKDALAEWPASYATTSEDDSYHQAAAAKVLETVGFKEVSTFSGRSGNRIQTWFYENVEFYRGGDDGDYNDD